MSLAEYFGDDLNDYTSLAASIIIDDVIENHLQQFMSAADAEAFVFEERVSEEVYLSIWNDTNAKQYAKAQTALSAIDFEKMAVLEFIKISEDFKDWFMECASEPFDAECVCIVDYDELQCTVDSFDFEEAHISDYREFRYYYRAYKNA